MFDVRTNCSKQLTKNTLPREFLSDFFSIVMQVGRDRAVVARCPIRYASPPTHSGTQAQAALSTVSRVNVNLSYGGASACGCNSTLGSNDEGNGSNVSLCSQPYSLRQCTLRIASVPRRTNNGSHALLNNHTTEHKTCSVSRSVGIIQVCGPARPDRLGKNKILLAVALTTVSSHSGPDNSQQLQQPWQLWAATASLTTVSNYSAPDNCQQPERPWQLSAATAALTSQQPQRPWQRLPWLSSHSGPHNCQQLQRPWQLSAATATLTTVSSYRGPDNCQQAQRPWQLSATTAALTTVSRHSGPDNCQQAQRPRQLSAGTAAQTTVRRHSGHDNCQQAQRPWQLPPLTTGTGTPV